MRELKFRYVLEVCNTSRDDPAYYTWQEIKIFSLNELENGKLNDWIFREFEGVIRTIAKDQYTGLKDKNGKEIYEGDILIPPNKDMRHVVRFGEYDNDESYEDYDGGHGWYLEVFDIKYPKKNEIFNMKDWLENMKIIGNIYENPELLEVLNENRRHD